MVHLLPQCQHDAGLRRLFHDRMLMKLLSHEAAARGNEAALSSSDPLKDPLAMTAPLQSNSPNAIYEHGPRPQPVLNASLGRQPSPAMAIDSLGAAAPMPKSTSGRKTRAQGQVLLRSQSDGGEEKGSASLAKKVVRIESLAFYHQLRLIKPKAKGNHRFVLLSVSPCVQSALVQLMMYTCQP